jgi:hypothetical protein
MSLQQSGDKELMLKVRNKNLSVRRKLNKGGPARAVGKQQQQQRKEKEQEDNSKEEFGIQGDFNNREEELMSRSS